MSPPELALAVVCASVFLGSAAVVSLTVKQAWFGAWRGSAGVVTSVLIGICWALVLGQLLGAVGWLRTVPLLAASVASAVAALFLRHAATGAAHHVPTAGTTAGRTARGPEAGAGETARSRDASGDQIARGREAGAAQTARGADADAAETGRGRDAVAVQNMPDVTGATEPAAGPRPVALLVATVVLVLLVGGIWVARTAIAVREGISDPDSLGYHLPFAVTFAQTGIADQNRFVLPGLPVQFYPANDELLVAIALVLTDSVAFAAVKNLVLGALVLAAAHAVGKAFGAGVLAVAGAAVVLGLPIFAFSQPGEAVNDILVVFLVLGGVAVLTRARDRPAPYVLALVCAGAAAGTKVSAIVPALALAGFALWLLVTRLAAHRLRATAAGAAGALAVGVSWYVRNAATYGSPLPPARLGIGPFQLPQITTEVHQYSYSVAWYLIRGRALRQFWNGLGEAMGPLFLPVIVAVLFGIVTGLRSGDRFRRGLAAVSAVAAIGYLTTPASAYGAEGTPQGFVINVHYAAAALVLGMVTAAIAFAHRREALALPVAGCVAVVTGLPAGQRIAFWAPSIGGSAFALLVVAAAAGGGVAWMAVRPGLRPWARAGSAATAALVLVGVGVIVAHHPSAEADPIRRWAAREQPTRIAGWVPEIALLYGPGAPNRAVTLSRLEGRAPVALDSCPAWMQALIDGAYPFTGVIPGTQWQRWLEADPAFELVAQRDGHAAIYRITGRPDLTCPGAR